MTTSEAGDRGRRRFPDDAVELWRWHDGVDADFIESLACPIDVVPGRTLLVALEDAVKNDVWLPVKSPFSDCRPRRLAD